MGCLPRKVNARPLRRALILGNTDYTIAQGELFSCGICSPVQKCVASFYGRKHSNIISREQVPWSSTILTSGGVIAREARLSCPGRTAMGPIKLWKSSLRKTWQTCSFSQEDLETGERRAAAHAFPRANSLSQWSHLTAVSKCSALKSEIILALTSNFELQSSNSRVRTSDLEFPSSNSRVRTSES